MKISSTSWHYRLWHLNRFRDDCPTSLCSYFWQVTGRIVLFFGVPLGVVAFLAYLLYYYATTNLSGLLTVLAVIGAVVAVAGLTGLATWWQDRRWTASLDEFGNPPKRKRKQPNLVVAWIKAKKEKVCPRIEVVDR